MKILALSDLHVDLADFTPPQVDIDMVVLAGDIHKSDLGIYWARQTWPDKEIIYIAGNHEYYRKDRLKVLENLRRSALEQNIYFLDNDEIVIGGVRFIGSTLWTDFNLFGPAKQTECMEVASLRMCDFSHISQGGVPFTPIDALELHKQSREWLECKLFHEPFAGKTVVISHHCPSWLSVAHQYQTDLLSASFASRLDDLINQSSLWIHGHTHSSFDYQLNGTRVLCNPRGYLFKGITENRDFDPAKVVSLT